MSWVNGRQLASASDGTGTYSYIYDAAGSRIMKNVGTVNHLYFYVNGMLLMEYRYNAMGDTTDVLQYFYDANGKPHAMAYNGTVYLYVTNLQGDIVALLGLDGTVSGYEYDPYGSVIASYGDIAAINPLRYRGYYYDNETGLYYLQSRYYDPVVGRFINADSYASTGQGILGYNMYAYCIGNPVNYSDPSGHAVETVFDLLTLGLSVADVMANPYDPLAWVGLAGDVIDLIPFVTGVGEAARGLRFADKLGNVVEIAECTDGTIDTYRNLRKLNKGTGNEVHHILEKRFFEKGFSNDYKLNFDSTNDMLSVALTKQEHRAYTNAWRNALSYGVKHEYQSVLKTGVEIYADNPKLMSAFLLTLGNLK